MTTRARLYDAHGEDRRVEISDDKIGKVDDKHLLWIDLDERTESELGNLAKVLELDPRLAHRLLEDDRPAGLDRFADQFLITIIALEPGDDGQLSRRRLDIVVDKNLVATVHDGRLAAIDAFDEELHGDRGLGKLDSGVFMAGVVEAVLANYFREIERIESDIDALDQVALRARESRDFLPTVVQLRHRIAVIRRALTPNRDALLPIARPDFETGDGLGQAWPGTIERLERAIDAVEKVRELLVGSFDIYLGRSAQRSNDVMKTLTLVSAIALPAIVLAGIMGMNFKLPFFDESSNFWVVLGAMVALAAGILGFSRWRGWI